MTVRSQARAPRFCVIRGGCFKPYRRQIIVFAIMFAVTVMFAASPTVTFNDKLLYELPLPDKIYRLWSVFRSCGRVIWIVIYTIYLAGCAFCARLLPKKVAAVVVCACLALQIYDLHGSLAERRENFNRIVETESILESDFWDAVAADSDIKHIVMVDPLEKLKIYEFADWALANGKTVNEFYFARSMAGTILENQAAALRDLSSDDLFVFFDTSNKLICSDYDLEYYLVDDYIVGYNGEIEGYVPLDASELYNVMVYSELEGNLYLTEGGGEDTDAGRLLYPGGTSFGPYWKIHAGEYTAEILGEGLASENVAVSIYSQGGQNVYDCNIISRTDTEIIIDFDLDEDAQELEVAITNNSNENILLGSVSIRNR